MKYNYFYSILDSLLSPRVLVSVIITIGICGLYFSTIITNPYTILYPSALLIGSIIFWTFRSNTDFKHINKNEYYQKQILITYFIVLFLLMTLYFFSGFLRTNVVFYFTFLLYLLSALYLFNRPNPGTGLLIILLSGLINRLTAYYGSAMYSGIDIYSHSRWAQSIAMSGSLEAFAQNKYFYAPFYHILTAVGELLYLVPTRDAIALTTVLSVTILPVLGVYILTTHSWSSQVGLIAGFLYVTADWAIRWSIHAIPTSLGLVFFALLLLSLIQYIKNGDIRHYIFILVFLLGLIFTHQVSLFIAITTIIGFAVVVFITPLSRSKKAVNLGVLVGLVTFLDFTTTKYQGPNSNVSFFEQVLASLFRSLMASGTGTRSELTFPQDPSIYPAGSAGLTLAQVSGSAILLALSIIGALYWISKKQSNQETFIGVSLSIVVTVLLIITVAGPVIGLRNLMPSRWWAFTYILLAILAAPGVLYLITSIREKISKHTLLPVILFIFILIPYIVLMGGTATASLDNPLIDDTPSIERYGITEQEKQLLDYIVLYQTESMEYYGDHRIGAYPERYHGLPISTIVINHTNPESLADSQPIMLIDRYYLYSGYASYYIEYDEDFLLVSGKVPISEVSPFYKSTVYSSGDDQITMVYKN